MTNELPLRSSTEFNISRKKQKNGNTSMKNIKYQIGLVE
jgi:hypothetical protein